MRSSTNDRAQERPKRCPRRGDCGGASEALLLLDERRRTDCALPGSVNSWVAYTPESCLLAFILGCHHATCPGLDGRVPKAGLFTPE
jgi:hypothetical protein